MRNIKEKHYCQMETDSRSMIPKLHPNARRFSRCIRWLRKLTIVSRMNPRTIYIYRSEASICMEKKRHIKHYQTYIIHPYSILSMYREIIMSITWLLFFTMDSFTMVFLQNGDKSIVLIVERLFVVICILHTFSCFFFGFHDQKKQEVVLDHKKIILRYLKTYFIFDFTVMIPSDTLLESKDFYWASYVIHSLGCVRFVTMTIYFRTITLLFDVGDIVHELLCMIVGGAFLAHWWAVVIYGLPDFQDRYISMNTEFSWIDDAKISNIYTNVTVITKYIQSLHKASALFFGCSRGMWTTEDPKEWFTFSLIILNGILYLSYTTAIILQLSMSYKMSESMYDKMLFQLRQYSRNKELPDRLKVRLNIFYEARYKEKFFHENVILASLSEHLRYEIIYHVCHQFIQSTWFFEGLNKTIVGHIIASLKSTTLITNEAIFSDNDHDNLNLYFVSRGSVALYTNSGVELLHIEDGDYFGEFNILSEINNFKVSDVTKSARYVASEITELFILSLSDFIKYIANRSQAMDKIMEVAKIRDSLNISIAQRKNETDNPYPLVNLREPDHLRIYHHRGMSEKRQYGEPYRQP